MKLSIIIPAYNEENTILNVLKAVKKVRLSAEKEIIVIDDCSKDGTKGILEKINDKEIKVYFHKTNKGKGAAIRTGLKQATGEFVIIHDADLEYDPEEFKLLIEEARRRKAKAVYGSRFKGKNKRSYFSYYFGNIFLSFLTSILYFSRISDMETCYKFVERKLLLSLNLKANKFDIEPEITAKLLKKGIKIYEIPISYKPRSIKQGKKIRWRDGFYAILTLLRYRFSN